MDYLQPKFYRFSEDSIWLSKRAASLSKGAKSILDLGTGCGVVGIETTNLIESVERLVLLEPQAEFTKYIKTNFELLNRDVEFDLVNEYVEGYESKDKFDLIVSNPPYFNPGHSRLSPNKNKSKCRTFENSSLKNFVEAALRNLSPSGQAFILARKDNPDLLNILDEFKGKAQVLDQFKDVALLNLVHE